MRILFVCNQGINRSRTAAELLSEKHSTRFGGLQSNIISEQDIEWAELILVMEEFQRRELAIRFHETNKKIISLDIPAYYVYNSPDLIETITLRFERIGLLS